MIKVNGVEFDVDVEFDRDGQIDCLAIFLQGSDVELSEVLDEKVIEKIEEKLYADYEGPNVNEDDPREDR